MAQRALPGPLAARRPDVSDAPLPTDVETTCVRIVLLQTPPLLGPALRGALLHCWPASTTPLVGTLSYFGGLQSLQCWLPGRDVFGGA